MDSDAKTDAVLSSLAKASVSRTFPEETLSEAV